MEPRVLSQLIIGSHVQFTIKKKTPQKEEEMNWINAGKWQDFLDGKRKIIIYANTIDMIWHIGIIVEDSK